MNQISEFEAAVDRSQFDRDGFAILQGFFPPQRIERAAAAVRSLLNDRTREAAGSGARTDRRTFWSEAEINEARQFRSDELYLRSEEIRGLALDAGLDSVLEEMLGEPAVLSRSTYFPRGLARTIHIDSQYIAPRTPQSLIAAWIAFEDVHPDAGPIAYYPGSHRIPLYCFNDGTHNAAPDEEADWFDYVDVQIRLRRLKERRFIARKGDVLVWHANLVHGGTPIKDPSRTRSSILFHFFGEADCRARGFDLVGQGGGSWVRWVK
jgi:ectoine hydroxylase-related dioxygenase (phytanoyl-CoA dioxygenase family)